MFTLLNNNNNNNASHNAMKLRINNSGCYFWWGRGRGQEGEHTWLCTQGTYQVPEFKPLSLPQSQLYAGQLP